MTSAALTVRLATEDDVEVVAELALELARSLGNPTVPTVEEARSNARRALADPRETIYLAELDGKPVAMCHISVRQLISEHAPVALVDELVVAEGFRGKGIGKRLVETARGFALERGCLELEVGTAAENTSACAFYRAVGFDTEHILFEMEFEKHQRAPA